MKFRHPISLVKTCIIASVALLPVGGLAQTGTDLFQGSGFTGLRHVDINQITTTDYLCDSSYFYLIDDTVSNDWVLNERAIYAYDNRGRESIRDIAVLKEEGWVPKEQIRSIYNSDFLNTRREYSWDNRASQWVPHTRHSYDYNYIGLINEIQTHGFKDPEWIAESKTNYTYNTEYLVEIESQYVWDIELNKWSPDSRNLFEYNNEHDVSKEVYQVWVDSIGEWVNETSEVYIFDDANNIISTIIRVWDELQSEWVNNSVIFIEYNEEGQPQRSAVEAIDLDNNAVPELSNLAKYDNEGNVDHLVTSHWDDNSGTWGMYQKQVNFWSEFLYGNLDGNTNEISCVFSNPYSIGLPWYCRSLKPDVVYTLRVYDLYGRTFYSDQFLGSSTFRVTQHLEPGYYIFEITGGLDKHFEKVYVKR